MCEMQVNAIIEYQNQSLHIFQLKLTNFIMTQ